MKTAPAGVEPAWAGAIAEEPKWWTKRTGGAAFHLAEPPVLRALCWGNDRKGLDTDMMTEAEASLALHKYADTVRRICFLHLKNDSDVEDVFQEVFLKYILHDRPFESDDHERSWLIRVSINACKDVLKSFSRKNVHPLDQVNPRFLAVLDENREVLDAVFRLPPKYRNVIYLHYYEGYSAPEIAAILGKNENTVYTWMKRARDLLRTQMGGVL